ncbi:MAG: hypothetical protein KC800_00955 [Candidatus Eremiobacteraeota bacterium]|nr:hypothetical protein [Candidatus Eremiobacteraeota bacterium]
MVIWYLFALVVGLLYVIAWLHPLHRPRDVRVLWSKGVALRCDHHWSDDYWIRQTEERVEPEFFARTIQQCEGLVYVRLGTRDRRHLDIEAFAQTIDKLKKPILLLTTDGDSSVPGDISTEAVRAILEHSLVLAWYTQNWDGTPHPKLKPFPIGLDFHTPRIRLLPTGLPTEFCLRSMARFAPPPAERKIKIFCDFHLTPNRAHKAERLRFQEQLHGCPQIRFLPRKVHQLALWRHYCEHAFVASTHGNGLDCHRTWEALLLGCIVVTKRSSLDSLFRGLPVVLVDDWSECEEPRFLEKWLDRYKTSHYDVWEQLDAERWLRRIRSER